MLKQLPATAPLFTNDITQNFRRMVFNVNSKNNQHISEIIEREKELIKKLRELPEDIRRQIFDGIMNAEIAEFDND